MDTAFFEEELLLDDLQYHPGQTHIFRINVEKGFERTRSSYAGLLPEKEIDHAQRFLHLSDRKNYLVRKYYLRLILAKVLSLPANELSFGTTENKKPVVSGVEFSTSHRGNYAVIAVSPGAIGIDIEKIDPAFDFKSIADSCYSEAERMFLGLPQATSKFYYLWTRKEAVLKASGEGIIGDLRLVECLPEQVNRNGITYNLTTFTPDSEYVVSFASSVPTEKVMYWHLST